MDTKKISFVIFFAMLLLAALTCSASGGIIQGVIRDIDTGEPIPFVTIRAEQTGQSMSANEAGEYRLVLAEGTYDLKFSHLAHYSEHLTVRISDSTIIQDIHMRPSRIVVPGITVSARAIGPGQRIILEAIKRKKEILAKLKSYSFEAYVKLVVREEGAEDSSSIFLVMESQNESYWEYPDKYKAVVTAQRQTANLEHIEIYMPLGELLNFNENRIDFWEQPVVSPTAEDALDYYNYYLLDTLYIDDRDVFRLEIEPKSQTTPLFVGEIMIADSTYDVVGVNVDLNEGFETSMLKDPHYSRKYEIFEDTFWMPVEIRMECDVVIPIFGRLFVDYVAVPHTYNFNLVHPKETFEEYAFEVEDGAFDVDSAEWSAGQLVPLTAEEIGGYKRLDSIAHAPKPIHEKLFNLTMGSIYVITNKPKFFHFNRVEGTYLGAAHTFGQLVPKTSIKLQSGYAFTGEYWQHDYGFTSTLSESQRLKFSFGYHDKIVHTSTIFAPIQANPTIMAALNKTDPFDYYLEKGFDTRISSKLSNQTKLTVKYRDYNQYSVPKATEFSVLRETKKHRENPPIQDGKLRALSFYFNYDSRKLVKLRYGVTKEWTDHYTTFRTGMEFAAPNFIDNDFDYRWYYAQLYRSQRTLWHGLTSVSAYIGMSDKVLPPQRYFTVDFDAGLFANNMFFKTLGETNFKGDRATTIYLTHNFSSLPFKKTGLPLIKSFSLGIYGGVFWTDFRNQKVQSRDHVMVARKAYSEIGFQIGRIIPLVAAKFYFSWQLSDYNTNRFSIGFGTSLFQ